MEIEILPEYPCNICVVCSILSLATVFISSHSSNQLCQARKLMMKGSLGK